MKISTAFFLAALMIPATALYAQGRGGGRPDMAGGAGIPECVGVARKILMTEYR